MCSGVPEFSLAASHNKYLRWSTTSGKYNKYKDLHCICIVHFAHSTSPHLKPLASNVNERQLIKISVHLEIDGCVWRPGGGSAVLFMPVYLLSYRPHTLWPSATKEQQAGCTFSPRTYCLFCCLRAKHLHSARWKPRGWPTYVLPSYILYTLHSDTQDIFAQVTSGDSYHLFTVCTPFWTSTNVDCDPTVADTAACLPSFLPPFLPVCPPCSPWTPESPDGHQSCTAEVNHHTQVSMQRRSCSSATCTNN